MKYLLSIICVFMITISSIAQDEKETIREFYLGFTFAPQAVTVFDNKPPFTLAAPLYIGPSMIINEWGISPFYSFGSNSVGVFLTYQIIPELGTYVVLDQSVNSNFGVYGLGFTTPLYKTYVQGFVEFNRSYGDEKVTAMSMGMYLTFGKLVKAWE